MKYDKNTTDGDTDDGEEDYTETDVIHVNRCLRIFSYVRDVLLLVLNIFTFIGDYSVKLAAETSPDSDTVRNLQVWNGRLCSLALRVQDAVTNVGAELYPPLDDEEIANKYEILLNLLREFLALVRSSGVSEILFTHNIELGGKLEELENLLATFS